MYAWKIGDTMRRLREHHRISIVCFDASTPDPDRSDELSRYNLDFVACG
jgi:hypothetical protein